MAKRNIDQFDMEAESEGRAIRGAFRSVSPVGKRIARTRSVLASVSRAQQGKVEARYLVKAK